ncbi:hypothetical protein CABS02_14190 [Colletotrichum abscissum]|uniref:Uncharacterized protein n=1 Tax=Colletotrichum abscissum TaxID=1671311 RepID=A0A9Q0AXQ4_9PEZI|nr:hypothetical protein CABS02_14190 [Colletotrichum abscissum]
MAARPLKRPRQSNGLPRLPTDIDDAVTALGGRAPATDLADSTIQSQKAPISKEERLEELVRHSGRLRQELGYWKGVALTGTALSCPTSNKLWCGFEMLSAVPRAS